MRSRRRLIRSSTASAAAVRLWFRARPDLRRWKPPCASPSRSITHSPRAGRRCPMSQDPEHFRRAPRPVSVAAIQMACDWDADGNIARAEGLVRQAAAQGAQIILLPELFETPYFCIEQDARHLGLARETGDSRAVRHFSAVARELGVVLPISFFERAGPAYFNSIAIL